MTSPQPPPSGTSTAETPRKTTIDITQVAASALAAVTAAVLGSMLGALGTLAGAAAGSVVYTVGAVLYKHYLERSRERVRLLAVQTKPFLAQLSTDDTPADRPHGDPLGEQIGAADTEAQTVAAETEDPTERVAPVAEREPLARRRRAVRWTAVAAGSVGAFAVAMMLITGFEFATGQTLGGHSGGLTLGRVADGGFGPERPAEPVPPSSTPGDAADASTTPTTAPGTTTTPAVPSLTGNAPTPTGSVQPTGGIEPPGGLPIPR